MREGLGNPALFCVREARNVEPELGRAYVGIHYTQGVSLLDA